MSERILCVDDDPNILDAYQRGLRKQFRIVTALGAEQALGMLDAQSPYAVIVSDMRMPGMDGVQFLASVKQKVPDTVRMMLTGNADQETAIEAVNEGNIFRFLTKPCPPEHLARALTAGIEQYRLITAEKELLGKTLRGSIKVLNDVLALSNPTAFGRASRLRHVVRKLCEKLNVEKTWEYEIAAMLSQIGCVTIPPDTLDRVYHGQKLSSEETQMLQSHPQVGKDLVANIPRLEGVAEIIACQQSRFDGSGSPSDSPTGKEIPLGARILKAALDYDAAKWSGRADIEAMSELREHTEWYDPDVFAALEAVAGIEERCELREIRLKELVVGMSLAADVRTAEGIIVVAKGQEVTSSLCARIKNFARQRTIEEPIRVLVRANSTSPAMAQT